MYSYNYWAPVTMNGESHDCLHMVTARSEKGPKTLTVIWVDGKRYGAFARKHHGMRFSMLSFAKFQANGSSTLATIIFEANKLLSEVPYISTDSPKRCTIRWTLPEVYFRKRE